MDIKTKDIIGIGIASLLLFPVLFFTILLATGAARLEVGGVHNETRKKLMGYLDRHSPAQERQDLEQSRLFEANRRLTDSLDEQQKRLQEDAARLELLKLTNEQTLAQIDKGRAHIDRMVGESKALTDQKIEELAQLYGSMKPVEAAPILLNLDDTSIARILKRVPEVRAQAKLMAALGAQDNRRAANITRILGLQNKGI